MWWGGGRRDRLYHDGGYGVQRKVCIRFDVVSGQLFVRAGVRSVYSVCS